MTKGQSYQREQDHWKIQQLLARYADLILNGRDAGRLYPNIEEHLKTCDECRTIVDFILTPSVDDVDDESALRVADLSFMADETADTSISVSPLSDPEAFRVHIALSLSQAPAEIMRSQDALTPYGFDPLSTGGRLLLFDTIALGDEELEVMLTLHQDPDTDEQHIEGQLFGETVPERVRAQLYLDEDTHFIEAENGELYFPDVTVPDDLEQISLTLESVHST